MKSGALSTVVFLLKICVDTPVQCSFNMKNQQVRKHTVKTTYFYSSNFGENANVFLQYDFVKMLIFDVLFLILIFDVLFAWVILLKLGRPEADFLEAGGRLIGGVWGGGAPPVRGSQLF